jgi:hypothetical protein
VRNRLMSSIFAGTAVLVLLPSIFARPANQSPGAKSNMEAGTQDLTGVWAVDHFQPNLFSKLSAPLTPSGAAKYKIADTNVNDPNLACLPQGVPRIMFVPLPFEIFQVPGRVLLYQEAGNQLRQIHLDRPHLKDPDPTYNGDSIGKWEGDTLVVDTIGFNDITWVDHVGLPHSDALHVIERIRRVNHDTLQDDLTIDDPKTYTKPWTATQIYKLHPGWEIAEYVCDNNKYVYHEK